MEEGTDAAIYRGDDPKFTIKRIRDIVTVQDHRKDSNDDQLENVQTFLFHDGEITLQQLNKGPVLTGEKGLLKDGYKNWRYVINESDLLKGYADPNEDVLKVINLESSEGALRDLGNGSWEFIPSSKFEGTVKLIYLISDGHGGEVSASHSFDIKQAVVEGTNQTESLTGNGRDEWIYAYNGFDTIRAAGGDDRAYGIRKRYYLRWFGK